MFKFFPLAAKPFSAALVLGAACTAGWSQPAWPRLDPGPTLRAADATTPVPPAVYSSSLSALSTPAGGVETGRTDWKSANDHVGCFPRGHADWLKQEAASPAPAAAPAQPKAKP